MRRQAPTVAGLDVMFGHGHGAEWLLMQLRALFRVTTERNAVLQAELIEFAPDFVTDCGGMKLTEMMVFFSGFRSGRFGESFALPSPRTVGMAFRHDFLPYILRLRAEVARVVEERRNGLKPLRRPGAVTHEEFERMREFRLRVRVKHALAWPVVEGCALDALPEGARAWPLPAVVAVRVDRAGLSRLNDELLATHRLDFE